jgi:hypothetical protein
VKSIVYSKDDLGFIETIESDRTLMAQPDFSGSSWATNQAQSSSRHLDCLSSISEITPESLIAMSSSGHILDIAAPLKKITIGMYSFKHYMLPDKLSNILYL